MLKAPTTRLDQYLKGVAALTIGTFPYKNIQHPTSDTIWKERSL